MDCLRGLLQNLKLEQENIRNASKVVYTIRSMSHDCTCVDMAGYWPQLSPITSSLTLKFLYMLSLLNYTMQNYLDLLS